MCIASGRLYAKFCFNPSVTARVKISQNVDILAKVYLVHLTLLWLQGSTSVKMLIYLPRYI